MMACKPRDAFTGFEFKNIDIDAVISVFCAKKTDPWGDISVHRHNIKTGKKTQKVFEQ
jgi:hypothetical protein